MFSFASNRIAAVLSIVFVVSGEGRCQAPEPPSGPQTILVAVGDILLGRRLGAEMEKSGDYSLPFTRIADPLRAADIAFGNLEGAFCEKPPYPSEGMTFRLRPRAVESLTGAGFDVVSVANNHFGDGGEACIKFSVEHLRNAGILPAGAGANFDEAHRPAVIERNGVRFAFLAYTYAARNDAPKSTQPVIAGRDPKRVALDVAAARAAADVVIVSLHDGAEYTSRVLPETVQFARAAIDAGAAVVVGHHPHVPQRVEQYKDGWIFYSLGNFAFQQNSPPATRTALMARLTFTGAALARVEAVPVVIEWYSQPRPATPEESAAILKSIGLENSLVWAAPPAAAPVSSR